MVKIIKKEQITVKVDKHTYNEVKRLFGGLSFNKALKSMLIHSGDYIPPEGDTDTAKLYENIKYWINSRLKNYSEQLEERFCKIEANL